MYRVTRLILSGGFAVVLLLGTFSAQSVAAVKMRPYSGIGVLQLTTSAIPDPIPIYDEPGIARCCTLQQAVLHTLNAWLFGTGQPTSLLVTDRKGEWLEVEHDDAGRTGWVRQQRRWQFSHWDQFLKGKLVQFLPNSPKPLVQLVKRPEATEGEPLSPQNPLKVIVVKEDWAYVMFDQHSAGWIRWRDRDGRLLIGLADGK